MDLSAFLSSLFPGTCTAARKPPRPPACSSHEHATDADKSGRGGGTGEEIASPQGLLLAKEQAQRIAALEEEVAEQKKLMQGLEEELDQASQEIERLQLEIIHNERKIEGQGLVHS